MLLLRHFLFITTWNKNFVVQESSILYKLHIFLLIVTT